MREKGSAHEDCVDLYRVIYAAAATQRRKNGIAAFHDYADISGITKSLSCTAFM